MQPLLYIVYEVEDKYYMTQLPSSFIIYIYELVDHGLSPRFEGRKIAPIEEGGCDERYNLNKVISIAHEAVRTEPLSTREDNLLTRFIKLSYEYCNYFEINSLDDLPSTAVDIDQCIAQINESCVTDTEHMYEEKESVSVIRPKQNSFNQEVLDKITKDTHTYLLYGYAKFGNITPVLAHRRMTQERLQSVTSMGVDKVLTIQLGDEIEELKPDDVISSDLRRSVIASIFLPTTDINACNYEDSSRHLQEELPAKIGDIDLEFVMNKIDFLKKTQQKA
jgi:hypothetical protein